MTTGTTLMEAKKMEQPAVAKEVKESSPKFKWSSCLDFVGDVKSEFHKISWTTPQELRTYTKLVVGATFLCGMGIYAIDLSIQSCLHMMGAVFHFIFG